MTSARVVPTEPQPAAVPQVPLPQSLLHQPQFLFNRELSWLEFNRRVLEEALDRAQPLLERLKFLAIFATNLDEFFMIRVSGLQEEVEDGVVEPSPDGLTPAEQLKAICERLRPLLAAQMDCLRQDVLPALRAGGIVVSGYAELSEDERHALNLYFIEHVFPVLTPQAVDPAHPFPYISSLTLNLAVMIDADEGAAGARFARVKVPPLVPRLVSVGAAGAHFVWLEDLIAANVAMLFPGVQTGACHLFRVTRDADLEIREDEAGDLLRMVEQQLRRRRFGDAVRLEVAATMPAEMTQYLTTSLELTPDDVYTIDGPLNIPDLMRLYGLERTELKDQPLQATIPAAIKQHASIFAAIKQQDILLHHPYTAYTTVTDFIHTAAHDKDVLAIKMCLYRTGQNSPIVQALIEASEQGKQVAALVELKARFDEENNIEWARRLEQAGVHVVYGVLGLKTHCKLTLVVRREEHGLQRYVHVATGNYNPTTSRIYTDLGLFTADESIGADATELFNYLTGCSRQTTYRRLLVAPVNLRARMTELIARETRHAQAGRTARIIAKLNSLTDLGIIRALYEAAQAGVQIDLIVRGVCALRPGVPGLSEHIRVLSVVGRFLEHSRIFYFANDGAAEVYIGSADWMHRNLDRRVEVVVPVRDPRLTKYLRDEVLETYLHDKTKARYLQADGAYVRQRATTGDPAVDAQAYFAAGNVPA